MGTRLTTNKTAVRPQHADAEETQQAAPPQYIHPLSEQPYPSGLTVLGTPPGVEHTELFFRNAQGLRICVQRWRQRDHRPTAALVCLHGLNTHGGYTFANSRYGYANSALEAWVRRGFAVYVPDHQGHGKSERVQGYKGTVRSFDDIAVDVWHLLEARRHRWVPVTCAGVADGKWWITEPPASSPHASRRPPTASGCGARRLPSPCRVALRCAAARVPVRPLHGCVRDLALRSNAFSEMNLSAGHL